MEESGGSRHEVCVIVGGGIGQRSEGEDDGRNNGEEV